MDIFHTTEFEKALKIFKSNPGAIFKIILLDIIFLLVYGFVKGSPDLSGFLGKIYEYLKIFLTLTSQKAKDLTLEVARQVSIFSLIDENPLIAKYFYLLLLAFLLFGLVTYFLYSFMQGSSWYLNAKLTSETPSYKNYIKQFFKVNILWFLLYVIFIIVGFINSFRFTILERSGTPNPPGLDIFIIVLIIIIAYFGSISYALIGQRKQIIK
ncbi:MAG: hypothetical protein QGH47_01090, partial [Candidatus Woesearchaeota archaeon]|nr:hypothetical protein [Candidatus Woesearchaeota archaeon]